jgi:hypothetical protein
LVFSTGSTHTHSQRERPFGKHREERERRTKKVSSQITEAKCTQGSEKKKKGTLPHTKGGRAFFLAGAIETRERERERETALFFGNKPKKHGKLSRE